MPIRPLRLNLQVLGLALLLAGCDQGRARVAAEEVPPAWAVAPDELAAEPPAEALAGVVWQRAAEAGPALFVGAAGAGGLVLRAVEDGREYPGIAGIEPDHIAMATGFPRGGRAGPLFVASDRGSANLWLLDIDVAAPALRPAHLQPLYTGTEVTGLCTYRSPASGRHYVFVAGGDGLLQQWELTDAQGGVRGRRVRDVALGAGIGACAVDDAAGTVYVADEQVGIWQVAAEPEGDAADRRLVMHVGNERDAAREVSGLALYRDTLLALLDEGERLQAFALPGATSLGMVVPVAGSGNAALGELEAIWAGDGADGGVILLSDPKAAAGPRWQLVPWASLAAVLQRPPVATGAPRATASALPTVTATVETEPVDDHGDAADDVAIWVDPADPAKSLIIGAQKKRGLELYDLGGRRLQLLADGRMNNVDLRQGVTLGGQRMDIIAASNRTRGAISLYTLDARSRRLQSIGEPVPTGMRDPYGLCMYVSARDGRVYVFVNNSDRGEFGQWLLERHGAGIGARLVREFVVGSQAEGCVADDASGALYITEEDVGLWRYAAEPDGGDARDRIDATGEGGRLAADVEGLALFQGPGGGGYLVVSNQGADNYALYRRDAGNAFVGFFAIGASDDLGIDGASETDGLDVTSHALGPAFPHGLLVVQDGRNITPAERQNFKLVPWERVAAAMGLPLP